MKRFAAMGMIDKGRSVGQSCYDHSLRSSSAGPIRGSMPDDRGTILPFRQNRIRIVLPSLVWKAPGNVMVILSADFTNYA